jgi:hypothetical protein
MITGMLWLDDDKKRPFDEKVKRAADYYQTKYGRKPTVCLVNPKMLAQEKKIGKIVVSPIQTVLPYHFWLGVESG